jgi:hypothetical protein
MTPSGTEPETFRFVAQYLNHCATAIPIKFRYIYKIVELNGVLSSPVSIVTRLRVGRFWVLIPTGVLIDSIY